MSLSDLPVELVLYIVENYYHRPHSLSCVNKEMNTILKNHMKKEYKIYKYIEKCKKIGCSWVSNLFTGVRTIEECDNVSLIITRLFPNFNFNKRIQYIINNSNQIPTEIWYKYIAIHN